MTQVGKYRRRIDIQIPKTVQDSTGSIVPDSWKTSWRDVPAAIDPVNGREFFAAQGVQSDVTAKISFRWRPGLDTTMRIVHHQKNGPDEIYNIEAILNDVTGRIEITALCRLRSGTGFRKNG